MLLFAVVVTATHAPLLLMLLLLFNPFPLFRIRKKYLNA